ncbi:plasmid pRiA4b ORF-3 family protein [Photorhabdus akhurstii]|uniref:plasmid pRiA4b ORF-3 family protein n=1 Tax=Photorhabdus akhurstii TaxID=171438 RepID=UPI0037037B0A
MEKTQAMYQIKITLNDMKPPVWRRLIVPKVIALNELHHVIQIAMGWTCSHLYSFDQCNLRYGLIFDKFFDSGLKDSTDIPLTTILHKEKDKCLYVYDFGDYWKHTILLEKVIPAAGDSSPIPLCVKGKGTCPVEDSGGVWGYSEMLEEACSPTNPDRAEIHQHLMADIDVRDYNIEAINERLMQFYS